jgi:hypothetical protein
MPFGDCGLPIGRLHSGAEHFYNTLNYDHRVDFYRAMLEFLATDCGPEGL